VLLQANPPLPNILQRQISGPIVSSGCRIASGMTTYKPYQYFTLLSDIRYPTTDILPLLPKAMDPVGAAIQGAPTGFQSS